MFVLVYPEDTLCQITDVPLHSQYSESCYRQRKLVKV